MTCLEILTWARGPGLALALAIGLFGGLLRIIEIQALGRKPDFSVPREVTPGSGWRTLLSRSLPPPGMLKSAPLTYLGGYVFHIGLAVAVFGFAPHIEVIKGVFGVRWPGLPNLVVDLATIAAIVAMAAVLVGRFADPVKRLLSAFGDWLAWALTFAPLVTGYAAFHHMAEEYTLLLAIHVLSVDLLLALLPFTKLFHVVSLFMSRWYNGDMAARKGVAV
jgi:nitrate reductase gamma subunit